MTRWPLLLVSLFVALAIDASLGHVLMIGDVSPRFVPILIVFVALFASRGAVLWSAWAAGLMVDLLTDLPHGSDDVGPLIGPHALGYVFGVIVVMQFRPVLLRRHVLTMLAMTFAFLEMSAAATRPLKTRLRIAWAPATWSPFGIAAPVKIWGGMGCF